MEVIGKDFVLEGVCQIKGRSIRAPAQAVGNGQSGFHNFHRAIGVIAVEGGLLWSIANGANPEAPLGVAFAIVTSGYQPGWKDQAAPGAEWCR